MKKFSRIACLVLCAALIAGLSVTAFADRRSPIPTPGELNYEINVENNKITVISNQKQPESYYTKDGRVTFRVDDHGMLMGYTTTLGGNKEVRLGKYVREFTVTGNFNLLSLSDTVDYHCKVTVDGTVNRVNITGDCKVSLTENAVVNNLNIFNDEAEVIFDKGARVAAANREPANEVVLVVDIRPHRYFTARGSYDAASNVLTLPAVMEGCTVQQAVTDAILKVEEKFGRDMVSGRWYWPNLNGGSTESGAYIYRFAPTDNEHDSVSLTINFISREDNK